MILLQYAGYCVSVTVPCCQIFNHIHCSGNSALSNANVYGAKSAFLWLEVRCDDPHTSHLNFLLVGSWTFKMWTRIWDFVANDALRISYSNRVLLCLVMLYLLLLELNNSSHPSCLHLYVFRFFFNLDGLVEVLLDILHFDSVFFFLRRFSSSFIFLSFLEESSGSISFRKPLCSSIKSNFIFDSSSRTFSGLMSRFVSPVLHFGTVRAGSLTKTELQALTSGSFLSG